MIGRDHVIVTGITAVTLATWVPCGMHNDIVNSSAFVVTALIGSLAPDLDSENSIASKKVGKFFSVIFQHRGFLHSIFGWMLWTWLCYKFICLFSGGRIDFSSGTGDGGFCMLAGLSFGYLAHLIEDAFSTAGVRWLNPFSPKDEKIYEKYGTLLRPVDHFEKDEDGHSIPCRHSWGRGYVVGSEDETMIVGFFMMLFIFDCVRLFFIFF